MQRAAARLTVICVGLTVISLMLAGQSYAEIDPETIVGLWLFNEGAGNTAGDSSGKGNDGESSGAKWVDGKFGKALEFDGTDDYIDAGNDASFDITDTMTLMAWYNPNVVSSSGSFLIIKRKPVGCADGAYALGTGPGYVGCAFWIFSGGWKNANFGDVLSTGEWYHLAGTYDGKTIRLFLNGEEKGSTVFSGPIVSFPDTHVYLGRECCGADRHFDGIIDEAAMFNVALSEDDIKDIMTGGLANNLLAVSPSGKLATAWGKVKARY